MTGTYYYYATATDRAGNSMDEGDKHGTPRSLTILRKP